MRAFFEPASGPVSDTLVPIRMGAACARSDAQIAGETIPAVAATAIRLNRLRVIFMVSSLILLSPIYSDILFWSITVAGRHGNNRYDFLVRYLSAWFTFADSRSICPNLD